MAEARNSFIKSKMNKDLDARLVPPGEYRDAQNVSVSKSEGADVGSLENILGNISLTDFGLSTTPNIDIIGFFMDPVRDSIFVFMTNYVDTSADKLSNFAPSAASCYIGVYNTVTLTSTLIVSGSFLNFSKTHPVLGVNVIDNNLFWSDNRNQPRKINITRALANTTYYTTEDQISLPKYYPFDPIQLVRDEVTTVTITDPGSGYTTGSYVNVATTGGSGSGLTLDITVGATGLVTAASINNNGSNYTNGDVVQLLMRAGTGSGADFELTVESASTMKDVVSEFLPDGTTPNPYYNANWPGDKDYLKEKFIRFAYRFKFDDGEYSLISPFTQECFVPEQDGYFIGEDEEKTMQSTELNIMRNKVNNITLCIPVPDGSTNWGNVVNDLKVDSIDIIFKDAASTTLNLLDTIEGSSLSGNGSTLLYYDYQSRKPFKTLPSRDLLRVSDQAPVRALSQEVIGNRLVFGNIVDKHTPPSSIDYDVSASIKLDQTPPAASVEPSEVRLEYQNHNLKQNRTYQVGVVLSDRYGRQSDVILSKINSNSQNSDLKGSTIFHPYKTGNNQGNTGTTANFSYYPGITGSSLFSSNNTWPGDQLKLTFNETISSIKDTSTGTPGLYSSTNPLGWFSYKFVVKQTEVDYYNVFVPGILNGYIDGETQDPLAASESEPVVHFVLQGDNLSKIPKDLSLVGPVQGKFKSGRPSFSDDPSYYQFTDTNGNLFQADPYTEEGEALLKTRDRERDLDSGARFENASVKLFPRVINKAASGSGVQFKRQYYPDQQSDVVVAIGTGDDLGLFSTTAIYPFNKAPVFYNYQSNPFIARMNVYTAGSDITEYGQVGPSPNAAEYEVAYDGLVGGFPNSNGYSDNGENVPVVFEGTSATQKLFKNKNMKISYQASSGVIGSIAITDIGGPWDNFPSYPQTGEASILAGTDTSVPANICKFRVKVTKSIYGPTVGLQPLPSDPRRNPLSIFETKPLESKLDIYWETSSAGKISDLNTNIVNNDTTTPYGFIDQNVASSTITWAFDEADTLNTNLARVVATDYNGNRLTSNVTMTLLSVRDALNNDVTSDFNLLSAAGSSYYIRNSSYFYYGSNSAVKDFYTFNIRVIAPSANFATDGTTVTRDLVLGAAPGAGFTTPLFPLSNIVPTISPLLLGDGVSWDGLPAGCGGTLIVDDVRNREDSLVVSFDGRNGTNNSNTANLRTDIQYTLSGIASNASRYYSLVQNEGIASLNISSGAENFGDQTALVTVTDGGGLSASCEIVISPQA